MVNAQDLIERFQSETGFRLHGVSPSEGIAERVGHAEVLALDQIQSTQSGALAHVPAPVGARERFGDFTIVVYGSADVLEQDFPKIRVGQVAWRQERLERGSGAGGIQWIASQRYGSNVLVHWTTDSRSHSSEARRKRLDEVLRSIVLDG